MCDPVTAAVVVGGISAASSISASRAANKQAEQQMEAARNQALFDQQQLELRENQEAESQSDQLLQIRRQAVVEQAAVRANAAAAGISGNSINRVIRRTRGGAADAESSLNRQAEVDQLALGQQATAITRGAQATIDSVPTIGALEGTLRAAGAGAQGYFSAGGKLPGGKSTFTSNGQQVTGEIPATADGFTQGPPRPTFN